MKLLLATNHLGLGGSESYLLTVAEQFDRLGHEVVIYTPDAGPGVAVAEERGLPVVGEGEIPDELDAALVQDGGVSYQVAERHPALPQLFVVHSGMFDLQAPPQLDGAVGALVALNDRIATRLRHYAVEVEVVRLHQPIDTHRFVPRGALPETPRTALLLSNTPHGDRIELIESACAAAGIELKRLGGVAGRTADIRPALAEADLVIGYGRSILEAMACGCAAYVYDWKGCDGWVTAETYPAIEAGGFDGSVARQILDRESLAAELGLYSADMGPVNHDLVMANHRAVRHAEALIELIGRLAPVAPRPRGPLLEMARLIRLEWRAQLDIQSLRAENEALRQRLHESESARSREYEERAAELPQIVAQVEARVETEVRKGYESSLSWRLTAPLRRLLRRLRGTE
jgi:hypothetical protein